MYTRHFAKRVQSFYVDFIVWLERRDSFCQVLTFRLRYLIFPPLSLFPCPTVLAQCRPIRRSRRFASVGDCLLLSRGSFGGQRRGRLDFLRYDFPFARRQRLFLSGILARAPVQFCPAICRFSGPRGGLPISRSCERSKFSSAWRTASIFFDELFGRTHRQVRNQRPSDLHPSFRCFRSWAWMTVRVSFGYRRFCRSEEQLRCGDI